MQRVCEAAALKPGGGIAVRAGGKTLALFLVEGKVYAMHDLCPHAGSPLSDGGAYLEGGRPVVVCPAHYWLFSLEDGRCPYHKDMQATVFAAEVREGGVWVDLPAELTGSI